MRYSASVMTRDQLMEQTFPEKQYLVDGLIADGSAVLWSGREKAGKSLQLVDLAVSLANDEPWLDRAVRGGPVLWLALEESGRTIRDRVRARDGGCGGYPLTILLLDGSVENEEFRLESGADVGGLVELIDTYKPVAVIIDPLREAHSGRENDSDDMAPRLRPLRRIAHQTGTTIIMTHHSGKTSGTFRGSTAIRASFDDEVQFTREDTDSDTELRGSIRAEGRNLRKTVEHVAFDEHSYRWVVANAPAQVIMPSLRRRILDVLHESDEWLDAQGLADLIPETKLKTIQNELARMTREKPPPFAIDPLVARKGSPRKFHGIHPRHDDDEIVPVSSGNDAGNEESKPRNITPLRRPDGEVVFG